MALAPLVVLDASPNKVSHILPRPQLLKLHHFLNFVDVLLISFDFIDCFDDVLNLRTLPKRYAQALHLYFVTASNLVYGSRCSDKGCAIVHRLKYRVSSTVRNEGKHPLVIQQLFLRQEFLNENVVKPQLLGLIETGVRVFEANYEAILRKVFGHFYYVVYGSVWWQKNSAESNQNRLVVLIQKCDVLVRQVLNAIESTCIP